MTLLAYGIIPRPAVGSLPGGTIPAGVTGRPVDILPHGPVAIVYSAAAADPPEVPTLVAFAQVIQHFHVHGGIVPCRYGCRATSAEQLYTAFSPLEPYHQFLTTHAGLDEMTIRLPWSPSLAVWFGCQTASPSTTASTPGLAYLRQRQQHYQHRDQRHQVGERFEGLLREHFDGQFHQLHRDRLTHPVEQIQITFLIERSLVEAFRHRFAALPRFPTEAQLSGPWALYTFAALHGTQPPPGVPQ